MAVALAAGCEARGTITVHAGDPCAPADATAVAVYLKVAGDCGPSTVTCGLAGFACGDGCLALCPDGYCDAATWRRGLAIDPTVAADAAVAACCRASGGGS